MRCPVLILALVSLILAGCEASFNLTTAGLSEPAVSTAVDLNTGAPLEKATIFPADVKTLYATVQLKNGPADTSVKAVFYYLEGNRQQIAEDTVKGEGSRHLSFSLNPPETGWPVGRYEVEFALNGEVKEKTGFSVVPAADMPVAKGFPPAGGEQTAPAGAAGQQAPSAAQPPTQPARHRPRLYRRLPSQGSRSRCSSRPASYTALSACPDVQDVPGQAVRLFLRVAR